MIIFITDVSAETIRITNGEWEPLLSKNSYKYGFNSHVITEAFKLEGVMVEWGFFPWERAYQHAKSGKEWHASCCWWPSDKIKRDFLISDETSKTSLVFFHLKSFDFNWSSIQDLQGLKIGVTSSYNYGKEFKNAIIEKKITVETAIKDEFNFKKLLAGRIKIFPNDPFVGKAQIRNSLSPEEASLLTYHPRKLEVSSLHLIISANNKRNKYFLDKFNAGMKKLKLNGQYQQMLADLEAGKYNKNKSIVKITN